MATTDKPPPGPAHDSGGDSGAEVLAPIKPPTIQWLKRLAGLTAFLAVHDRFPAHNGPEKGEHAANTWLSQQRHAFITHTLSWNQAAAMDGLGDWITTDREVTHDAHWRQRLDELVDFHQEHHHPPHRHHATSTQENVLGIWWQTQVSARNAGTMPKWRLDAINEAFPGWARGAPTPPR